MDNDTPVRQCSKCNEVKPKTPEYFRRNSKSRDGLLSYCKDCAKAYERERDGFSGHKLTDIKNLNDNGFRRCPMCGEIRPRTTDYFNRSGKDFSSYCKPCSKIKKSEDYYKHLDANREKRRDYSKAHLSQVTLQQKRWQENNSERVKENKKRHYEENKEHYYFNANKRLHQKRANGGSFTKKEIEALYEQQNGMCFYCWCDISGGYVKDHWIPVSKGGDTHIDNIKLCCAACNSSKRDKMPYEWAGRLSVVRIRCGA